MATRRRERASPEQESKHTPALRSRRTPNPSTKPDLVRSTNPDLNEGITPDLAMLDYRERSRDEQGVPVRWSLQVRPAFDAEVRRMVGTGRYFDELGALIRWCVFFGMDYLQRIIDPPFPSNIQVLKAMAADNAHFETRLQYLAQLDRAATNAYEALGRGMESTAVQIISRQIENVRSLPPGDEFRTEILKLLKQRFGHMLKKGQLVTFDELDEG